MGEVFHVVGPEGVAGKWVFLCPVCDDDRVTGLDGAERVCTAQWLHGQLLRGDKKVGNRTCYCFQSDPFEGETSVKNDQRRYFHYRVIALKLGGAGRRVDLPGCVREKVEELYGES